MWIHREYFYIWITINAYEAARNLLGFVLPFVTNFYVFLNLLLQTLSRENLDRPFGITL